MLPVPPLPWEDFSRRLVLPETLLAVTGGHGRYLVVPLTIVHKTQAVHPSDVASLDRLSELLDGWELVGQSPSNPNRVEIYGRLDGIWHTAVRCSVERGDAPQRAHHVPSHV